MNKEILIVLLSTVWKNDHEAELIGHPGDVLKAKLDGAWYRTDKGAVHHRAARPVNGLELIVYEHQAGTQVQPEGPRIRYRQYAKDELPLWALNVKLDKGD